MAELDTSGGGKGDKKVRSKKQSTRVDLTAMVDLAFLLITFFILTTTLQKPKAMDLVMPDKDEKNNNQLPVPESRTMTILLGSNNKLEWYMGQPSNPLTAPVVEGYGKNGIRKALIDKAAEVKAASGGKEMIVLVKPSDKSTYENMVSIMDELNVVGNQSRAIVDITQAEIGLLQRDGIY
ncbi:ExbD/TolR family protein [Mucilaginibacter auburnensis]|uniref:Biopolymer transport protein ExbD/TolR n=1 Tax=Mucilaginibacter auburnensis TaxID=1457233 RepID=A0A2H9VSE2_9SPHI|nr:biopolymer transporter ExbD [Mucilaginibacter auburnensis]PJJ83737.1 biopolymer transport protein ExbD/TolR [Mucilaginibacter auburnensis]